ncbi:D-ala-D-ala transporter subunit DdpD [Escherichia coli]|nr:D-ala-D-ala transporter subunit DdpD [Escherichia coli]
MTQPVLDIQQLHLSFPGFNGDVHALNNVSLQINRSEIVGLVGESGSGKSVTAMLIMRLLPTGSYCVHRGQISLLGEDVLNAREKHIPLVCCNAHQNMEYHASHYPPFQGRYQTSPICLKAALFAIVAMRQVHSVKTSRR